MDFKKTGTWFIYICICFYWENRANSLHLGLTGHLEVDFFSFKINIQTNNQREARKKSERITTEKEPNPEYCLISTYYCINKGTHRKAQTCLLMLVLSLDALWGFCRSRHPVYSRAAFNLKVYSFIFKCLGTHMKQEGSGCKAQEMYIYLHCKHPIYHLNFRSQRPLSQRASMIILVFETEASEADILIIFSLDVSVV